MKTGLLALSGPIESYLLLKRALRRINDPLKFQCVMGVDGGMAHLLHLEIPATILIGDFDSVSNLDLYRQRWPQAYIERFPSEKGMTDSELALNRIQDFDLDLIYVIGGFGGRLDHLVGNLSLLSSYKHMDICFLDAYNRVQLIEGPGRWALDIKTFHYKYTSIVPLNGTIEGITLKGFKYPLQDAKIDFGATIGISNEIIQEEAEISIKKGMALLINSSDKK